MTLHVQARKLIGVSQLFDIIVDYFPEPRGLRPQPVQSKVPYCGTSCWYIADIACEKCSRISSAVMMIVRHGIMPPVNITGVEKPVPSKEFRIVILDDSGQTVLLVPEQRRTETPFKPERFFIEDFPYNY